MDEFTGGYKMLENAFNSNENFDDAEFVEEVIEELENILRLNRKRTDEDILAAGEAYPEKIAELEEMLANAKKMQKTVQDRLTARLRNDKLARKFQIHQLYKTIGIGDAKKMKKEYLELFNRFLPEQKVKEILTAFQKSEFIKAQITEDEEISMFDPSYFYAFMDLLYSLPAEEQRGFMNGLKELVVEKPQLTAKIEKAVRLSKRPIDDLDRVLYALELLHSGEVSNYRKLFKDLIATLQDTSSLDDFDSTKKSAVWQFMNYEQLFKLQRDAKTQDRPESVFLTRESLVGIVDNFIPLIFMEEIDNHIQYGKSNLMTLTDNNTILRNNKAKAESGAKALFTPTSEQSNAINGIVNAFYKNKELKNKPSSTMSKKVRVAALIDIEKRREEELNKALEIEGKGLITASEATGKGVEKIDKRGTVYRDGDKIVADFVLTPESYEDGDVAVIVKQRKPQINVDGIMTQPAEVVIMEFSSLEEGQRYIEENPVRVNPKRIERINKKFDAELTVLYSSGQEESVEKTPQSSLYQNFVYLKGPAGAGKTNVVVRWVLAMLPQLKSKNIVAAGHNKHSAGTLHDSIKPSKDPFTLDELNKALEDGHIGEEVQFIVLDEVGGVNSDQLKKLAELTLKMNEARASENKNPVTVLVMGDPNQKVKSGTGTPAIELPITRPVENSLNNLQGIHTMTTVQPLTITFRSDNPSVVMLQKVFEGSTKKIRKLAGRANFTYEEIDNLDQAPQGSFVDSGTANLMKILGVALRQNPKKKKAIIVSNEKTQSFWKEKLTVLYPDQVSSGLIEVLTVEEAQGRTIPEVFVDIPLASSGSTAAEVQAINRDLYTATSRAADFVYLGNVPEASNNLDVSLEKATEKNKESKIKAFDEAIKENTRIINILKGFGIVLTKEGKEEDEVEDPRDPGVKSEKPEKENTEPDEDPDVETPQPGADEDEVEGVVPTDDEADETGEPEEDADFGGTPEDTEIITMKEPQANIFREIEFAGITLWEGLKKILGIAGDRSAHLITLHNGKTDAEGNLIDARLALVMPAKDGNYAIIGVFTKEEIDQYNIDFGSVPVSK
jgi:hypothetical protein